LAKPGGREIVVFTSDVLSYSMFLLVEFFDGL